MKTPDEEKALLSRLGEAVSEHLKALRPEEEDLAAGFLSKFVVSADFEKADGGRALYHVGAHADGQWVTTWDAHGMLWSALNEGQAHDAEGGWE